jgi:hypothetical protein
MLVAGTYDIYGGLVGLAEAQVRACQRFCMKLMSTGPLSPAWPGSLVPMHLTCPLAALQVEAGATGIYAYWSLLIISMTCS